MTQNTDDRAHRSALPSMMAHHPLVLITLEHITEVMKIECTKNIFDVTPSTHDRAHRFAGPSYLVLPLPTPKTI